MVLPVLKSRFHRAIRRSANECGCKSEGQTITDRVQIARDVCGYAGRRLNGRWWRHTGPRFRHSAHHPDGDTQQPRPVVNISGPKPSSDAADDRHTEKSGSARFTHRSPDWIRASTAITPETAVFETWHGNRPHPAYIGESLCPPLLNLFSTSPVQPGAT